MNYAKTGSDSKQFLWRIGDWFPELGKDVLQKLKIFYSQLLAANMVTNLINVKAMANSDLVHFADCLLASRIVSKVAGAATIYDVGSGNGFPALIYALLNPSAKIYFVESEDKKKKFVENASEMMGIKNFFSISTN